MRRLVRTTPRPAKHPGGVTLTEVLMSVLVMGIGVISVISLFPISFLRSVQATNLTNATILRYNAETQIDLNRILVDGVPLYTADFIGPLAYDKFFHAMASGAMVIIAWEAVKRWAGVEFQYEPMLFVITFLVVMGGGAVVEIAELIGSSMSDVSVGDYANNALDLVANAVGASIVIGAVWLVDRRRPID